jgi:trehalose/maltose transport system substrate-binding protein
MTQARRALHAGLSAVLLAVLLTVLLAYCRPGGAARWATGTFPGRTIKILSGTDVSVGTGDTPAKPGESGIYQQLAEWWNTHQAVRLGFRIQFDVIPGGATAVHSQMLAEAQTHSAEHDIYDLDGQWVPEFAANGFIRSLDGQGIVAKAFLPGPLASARGPGGGLYSVPFTTDVGLLYYRKSLVSADRLNRLHSFRDLMNLARDTHQVYAGQFARYEGLTVNALEAIWAHDRHAFADDGSVRDRKAVASGLRDLSAGFTGNPVPIPAAERSYTEVEDLKDFATGRSTLMRNWPIYYGQLRSGITDVGNDFGVVALPFRSALGGQNMAVATSSTDPGDALAAITFLTSADAERCLFAVGGFPATRGSAYDERGLPGNGLCGSRPSPSTEIAAQVKAALAKAEPRPRSRYYTEFSDVLQTSTDRMLAGADPDREIARLVDRLKAAAAGRAPAS